MKGHASKLSANSELNSFLLKNGTSTGATCVQICYKHLSGLMCVLSGLKCSVFWVGGVRGADVFSSDGSAHVPNKLTEGHPGIEGV